MGQGLREALEKAMDDGTVATPPPAIDAEQPLDAPPVESEAPPEVSEVQAKPEDDRPRAPDGKFAPKDKATPPAKAAAAPAAPAAPPPAAPEAPKPPEVQAKAPQSWSPAVREKWASVPPEVQAEVMRREKETAVALQQSADARRVASELEKVVAPYAAMMRAEGAAPMAAIGNLLQTAQQLRTAPPAQKAALVASIVQQFGVDIEALDAALTGQAPQQQRQPEAYRDPRVDSLMQRIEAAEQAKAQAVQQEGFQQIQEFVASGEGEFLEDVREVMADLLEVAARRGVALSVKDAYHQAVRLDPKVAGVFAQREAAKSSATATAATQRAKVAASSVKGQPAGASEASKPSGLRAHLEAAIGGLSGR